MIPDVSDGDTTASPEGPGDEASALVARDRPEGGVRQPGRRLSDKILAAFHHACDLGDLDVASDLLRVVERIVTRKPLAHQTGRRRSMESLIAAYERLWELRNPGPGG